MSDETTKPETGFKAPRLADYVSSAYRGDSPPTQWLIENRLPRAKPVVVAGEGGVGKSWLELELFVAINDGGFSHVWGGRVVDRGLPCLILSAEDDRSDIDNRLKVIRSMAGATAANHGYIFPCSQIGSFTLFKGDYADNVEETDAFRWLDKTLGHMRAMSPDNRLGFVAIDTLSSLTSINENDNTDATAVMVGLSRLAAKHDVTVIVLHHFSKGGSNPKGGSSGAGRVRGASGIVNSARLVIGVEHVLGDDAKNALAAADASQGRVIKMEVLKANGQVWRSPVTLAWPEGGGMIDVSDLVGDSSPRSALLAVIKGFNDRGQKVTKCGKIDSVYKSKSDTWPESLQSGRDKLESLVQGAIDDGLLQVVDGGLFVPEASN